MHGVPQYRSTIANDTTASVSPHSSHLAFLKFSVQPINQLRSGCHRVGNHHLPRTLSHQTAPNSTKQQWHEPQKTKNRTRVWRPGVLYRMLYQYVT